MLAWGQLSFLGNCMHTSDPLREQSVELPVVQKVCESFLFTYCKDLVDRTGGFLCLSPPYSRSWGSPFPTLPTSLSLSLSFNGGWKRKGSPRTKSTVPASLFFVKLPCVERRRFAALVADINSVMSLRSWLPNVFWWVCTFQAKGCKGEASGCPASHAFLAFAFQSPENKQKKKMGKLVLQARILMRISALSTSVTKLNYLGSMSMNYATDHMSRRQNLWHERKRIS